MKKILLFLSLAISLLFTACSDTHEDRLKISATTWIGYTPFFYLKEKGLLKPLNIKLVYLSSLAENMYLYEAGNSDAFTGTQYEYKIINEEMKSLIPIILLDRSNGGDLVMSNSSIEELQENKSKIDVYLEMDSVNYTVLQDFIAINKLKEENLRYHNMDQIQIEKLQATNKPTIIVTYIPYNLKLEKQGFKALASTKESLNLLVVDALFTGVDTLKKHKKQFESLKILIDKAIADLEKDPKAFYDTVKPYLLEMSYEEFLDSIDDIVWINKNISPKLKSRMLQADIPTRNLL